MAIVIKEIRRVSANRDMLDRGLAGRLTVQKQEDGTFKATVDGQGVEGHGQTSEDAIRAAKTTFRDKFLKGQQEPQRTV